MSGKTGWCSLCQHPKKLALNNAIAAGKGYTVVQREMEEYGLTFSKGTFLRHKAHITSPLLTAAEEARQNPAIAPQSNRAVLEMIRDLGAKKALENPDEISVNHALRAAKILQDAEGKQEAILIVLAKAVQAQPMIEGSWKELETQEA